MLLLPNEQDIKRKRERVKKTQLKNCSHNYVSCLSITVDMHLLLTKTWLCSEKWMQTMATNWLYNANGFVLALVIFFFLFFFVLAPTILFNRLFGYCSHSAIMNFSIELYICEYDTVSLHLVVRCQIRGDAKQHKTKHSEN